MRLLALCFLLLLNALSHSAHAQTAAVPTSRPSTQPLPSTTFSGFIPADIGVLTVGPGTETYELFGHNVLVFMDRSRNAVAYNWGVFNFEDPGFIQRFIMGSMRYQMQPTGLSSMIEAYRSQHRAITFQSLSCTPDQVALAWNWCQQQDTDATRSYLYDYYRDNCSTRVRDALNTATEGRLKAILTTQPSGTTYRWQTLRCSASTPWMLGAMTYLIGHPGDRELSRYEEAFVPMELSRRLDELRLDGQPIVMDRLDLDMDVRISEAKAPPRQWPYWVGAGMAVTALICLTRPALPRVLRWLGWLACVVWLTVSAVVGSILIFLGLFTGHVHAQWNENILQLSPLAGFVLIGLLVGRRGFRWCSVLGLSLAALSLLGLLLKTIPAFSQPNWPVISLALPANLALAWALFDRQRRVVR